MSQKHRCATPGRLAQKCAHSTGTSSTKKSDPTPARKPRKRYFGKPRAHGPQVDDRDQPSWIALIEQGRRGCDALLAALPQCHPGEERLRTVRLRLRGAA
jgi:hypothetical protein